MIKLVGTFLNDVGKKHTFTMKEPNIELSPAKVKESLELLTALNLFEKDGTALFQKAVSAKYVETIETPIFKEDEFFGEAKEPIKLNQPLIVTDPVLDVAEESINEENTQAGDPQQMPAELTAQSSYRKLPEVPVVTLKEVSPEVKETSRIAHSIQDEKESGLYNLILDMLRRRNQRKAQEQQKKNPD